MEINRSTTSLESTNTPPEIQMSMKKLRVVVSVLVFLLFSLILGGIIFTLTSITSIKSKDEEISSLKSNLNQVVTQGPTASSEVITQSPTPTNSIIPSPVLTQQTYNLKVFFSKDPESANNPAVTFSKIRSINRLDLGTYAIEQLIVGPNDTERLEGFYSPIKLIGASNCSNKDFTLEINPAKKATLKFCKQIDSNGVVSDGKIKSVITETLKQFSTVDKVTILTNTSSCFGDQSGLDLCKNS